MCAINPYCSCGYGEPDYFLPVVIGLLFVFVIIIMYAVITSLANDERDKKEFELCMLKENNKKICQLEVELR